MHLKHTSSKGSGMEVALLTNSVTSGENNSHSK